MLSINVLFYLSIHFVVGTAFAFKSTMLVKASGWWYLGTVATSHELITSQRVEFSGVGCCGSFTYEDDNGNILLEIHGDYERITPTN